MPKVFPSGRNNPMGLYALYVGNSYALHGTNVKFGIGLRVTHGCVRLRDEDIKYLYYHVPVGTRVQFINEPIKFTLEPNGYKYIEVHNPISITEEQFNSNKPIPIKIPNKINNLLKNNDVDHSLVKHIINRRSGIPEKISINR